MVKQQQYSQLTQYIVLTEERSQKKSKNSYEAVFHSSVDALEEQQFVEYTLGYPCSVEYRNIKLL